MANRRYERLFRDPEVKAEMLDLRRQGYTFSDIARKYGADCTTILFHCQIAGLALTMEQQKEMRVLIRENLSVEEVGDRLGVNGSVITLYCTRNGVPGSDRFPTKGAIKKMELEEGQIHAQEKNGPRTGRGAHRPLRARSACAEQEARTAKEIEREPRRVNMFAFIAPHLCLTTSAAKGKP